MELFLVLLVLFFILAPLIALAKSLSAAKRVEDLEFTVRHLETELGKVQRELEARTKVEPKTTAVAPEPTTTKPIVAEPPVIAPAQPPTAFEPEPVPVPPLSEAPPIQATPPTTEAFPKPPSSRWAMPTINWEQFMGVKLFAWIGGLALFIGVALFLKYSFEHNLIPPALRATMGFFTGVGLVTGDSVFPTNVIRSPRKRFALPGLLSFMRSRLRAGRSTIFHCSGRSRRLP